jgi:3-hydroxyanthranilate 3,4-dioxygenase
MLDAFKVGAQLGNYEDLAVLPIDVDPQVTLSRNWIDQPFYQIFAEDTVLAAMSGETVIRMRLSTVNTLRLEGGDHAYIPAGTPHRIEPRREGVMLRYLAGDAGLEAAAWFCELCGTELYRLEWRHDHDAEAPRVYAAACARFNAATDARTCGRCGSVAAEIDLDAFGWTSYIGSETRTPTSDLVDSPAR